ncbi:putative serine protease PepD [Micromonospora sp. Llam0]|uniref:S1C family serine protease n=1 Tax=Micromonospora sp. Llam0 TaxID=2485143 RepID=UPI000F486EE1|nr:trypsin-like peptidase domain-containing protein [Micromonospora sp. Llam0]ROO50677.1 putative serine protease PepD [Micromonospora sp. Llam0]
MSEHETTPPAEPSDKAQPPASPWQAPAASGQPDPAAGRSSTDWTPTNQPYAGSPAPAQPAPEALAPAQPAPSSPAPEAPASAQPASAQPVTGPPLSGQPQAGPYAPGYAQVPYGQHGQWSHGQPYAGHGYGQPHVSWSPPPGAAAQAGAQRPPNRVGRIVAGSAVVLALMLGSGAVGGAVVAAFDNGGAAPAVQTGSNGGGSAAPVIDRSSLAEIADAVQDSVVSISTGSGEGSGVVLNAEGFILTNNHVVESARGGSVTVYFADGGSASGSVVGTDARTDLAVVKVDDVDGLSPATLGDSSTMRVGDTVLALGSPLGLQGSVTAGIISAQDRTISVGGQQQSPFGGGGQVSSMSGLLQTDAPINPGNSGGALVNTNGEVIGINTAIATSGQGEGNIGVGFAIPSNKAADVAEALMAGEEVSHPYLGVSVTAADEGGALIAAVEDGSPADQAGLAQGDVVVQIGDTPVNDSDDLVAAVQSGQVGEQIEITYERDGEARTASATLVDAP